MLTEEDTIMPARPTRRSVVTTLAYAGVAMPAVWSGRSWAAGRSISVGTFSGPMADFVRQKIVPGFEADYSCRVYQTENFTLGQIALLRQQKVKPTYSVIMMDDTGIPIAKTENLIAPLDPGKIPNMGNAFPRYVLNDSHGVAFTVSTVAPFVNPANGPAIASYADLWDERFRGRLLMISPNQGGSVMLLIAAAALATGKPLKDAQYAFESGYAKLAELKPNVMTTYDNHVTAILQIAQGEADIGAMGFSKDIVPYQLKGAAVQQCFPKEGVFGGVNCLTLVKNAPEPELGRAFIDRILSVEIQKGMAETLFSAPTVRNVVLNQDAASRVAYPEKRLDEMNVFMVDWDYINARRGEIVERLNNIFRS
ncbi:hypothetical protein OPKNFCMD_6767 [Methylobacterium crusticola]|uniref:Extracellular solute-binding protein n=1 Tax=Methylobacterium crusticola TaxID=1697972 RepID=A0ABQ4R9A8_9HYPH|nr:extracellular solute-binding protein [Methylobacterium crusticola]GJD53987.1 hypothetical protein OPKNFCMD_6767 [Methylobacterium crusticola]